MRSWPIITRIQKGQEDLAMHHHTRSSLLHSPGSLQEQNKYDVGISTVQFSAVIRLIHLRFTIFHPHILPFHESLMDGEGCLG
jgi:hypothetical protein